MWYMIDEALLPNFAMPEGPIITPFAPDMMIVNNLQCEMLSIWQITLYVLSWIVCYSLPIMTIGMSLVNFQSKKKKV